VAHFTGLALAFPLLIAAILIGGASTRYNNIEEVPGSQIVYMIDNDEPVSISNAVIKGDLDFNKLKNKTSNSINSSIKIENSSINGIVNFDNAILLGSISFEDTVFAETASFFQTNFKENTTFEGAHFNRTTTFQRSFFEKSSSFKALNSMDLFVFGEQYLMWIVLILTYLCLMVQQAFGMHNFTDHLAFRDASSMKLQTSR
jgi:Pentapeptide repeats (9 copies)